MKGHQAQAWAILFCHDDEKPCYKRITWFKHSYSDNCNVIVILCKIVLTSQSFSKSSISLDSPCKSVLLAGQLLLSCFHREMRKLRSWFKFSELAVGKTEIRNKVLLCSCVSTHSFPQMVFISWCLYPQITYDLIQSASNNTWMVLLVFLIS